MAKGRKLTTSLSERFLGSHGAYAQTHGFNAADSSELREEDVWSTADDVSVDCDGSVSRGGWESRASAGESNGSASFRSMRKIPRDGDDHHRGVGGLSLAFEDPGSNATTASSSSRILHQYRAHEAVASPHGHHMATSAPVNVPDWSKILRVDSVESLHDIDDGFDDDESEMVPPHEYLARSRKMAANSVFEGVGRTLKGRDMRRVRDAVWSQTGFDG